ncbi:MAG: hypothetical protein FWB97_00255 [Oscillospiraceae bacterium]|nr:hypothetical protein [Oscillospiraceae bacterium]
MIAKQLESSLISIIQSVIEESTIKLESLPIEAHIAVKAQRIRRNMALHCKAIAFMEYGAHDPIYARQAVLTAEGLDSKMLENCPNEEITYLHALWCIERLMQHYSAELIKANNFNDDEKIFVLETQLEVLSEIVCKIRDFGKLERYNLYEC